MEDEESFYKELGERIKEQRLKLKMSQDHLAGNLSLTRTSVVNFERGKHRPSIFQLIRLSELLDIDFTQLIPYTYGKEQKVGKAIDMENVVVSDQEDLKVEEKTALAGFLRKISKD